MKGIKDLNKWRFVSCSRIGRVNIVKMSIVPELFYRFNEIPLKNPTRLLVDIDKTILKFEQKQSN